MNNKDLIPKLKYYVDGGLGHISIKDLLSLLMLSTISKGEEIPEFSKIENPNLDLKLEDVLYKHLYAFPGIITRILNTVGVWLDKLYKDQESILLREVITLSSKDLIKARNFGKLSLSLLKDVLSKYNLKLKDD